MTVVGRKSPYSLYSAQIASFEDDAGAYDQKDAAGFIKLQVGDSWSTQAQAWWHNGPPSTPPLLLYGCMVSPAGLPSCTRLV